MAIDGKKIIRQLREKRFDDRKKIGLYLSESLYADFQHVCKKEGLPASVVLEEVIREFLATANRRSRTLRPLLP